MVWAFVFCKQLALQWEKFLFQLLLTTLVRFDESCGTFRGKLKKHLTPIFVHDAYK